MRVEELRYPETRPAPNPASTAVLSVLALVAVLCAGVLLGVDSRPAARSVARLPGPQPLVAVTGEVDLSTAGDASAAAAGESPAARPARR